MYLEHAHNDATLVVIHDSVDITTLHKCLAQLKVYFLVGPSHPLIHYHTKKKDKENEKERKGERKRQRKTYSDFQVSGNPTNLSTSLENSLT